MAVDSQADTGAGAGLAKALARMARALLLALLGAAAGLAAAQAGPPRNWADREIAAQYWADGSGKATLDGARAAFEGGLGQRASPAQLMPLGGGAAVWYRLQLPVVDEPARAVFSITFPGTDSVDLFRSDGAGGWRVQRSGDVLPVNEWPVQDLYPTFAFTLQPGEVHPTYMRVLHTHPIRVNWVLWDARSFNAASKAWHLGLGAYIGFVVLVMLLSLFNAYSWRDPIHLYFTVHVVLVGLSILSLAGLAGEYLWPNNAWWNDKAPLVLPAASFGWAALFVRELVAERGARVTSWSLLASAAVSFALAAAFLALGREPFYRVPSLYFVPVAVVVLAVLVAYAWRRPEPGLWVLAGISVLVLSGLLPMMRTLGLLPVSFMTEYGVQLGGALEIPLVLVGIYLRSGARRDNRQRMGALARTDPLTGVSNHRVLVERLRHLLAPGRRSLFEGAVMQVHVANLEAIREQYGREAAEAALVRAAECVTREAKVGDTVAREEGGDLVLVLEGQVSRGQATECGRNLIARGLKFSGKLPPRVTLNLRVAGVMSPLPEANAAVLMGMLGRVILEIGRDPMGRALRFIGSGDEAPRRASYRGVIISGGGPP